MHRVQIEQFELEFGWVHLVDIFSHIELLYRKQAEAQGLNFELRCQPENLMYETVFTDYTRLMQILVNIISNAIKYTPQGFVKVIFSCGSQELYIQVKDSGTGITEKD